MTPSLFKQLNVNSKDEVDEGAVIEAAQQNPNDIDRIFEFSWYRCCPLHKALELELGDDVIKSLISPFAIRHKDDMLRTPLHIICGKGASLESLSMVLNAWPEAAREKDRDGRTPLHWICANESASYRMMQTILDEWLKAKENRTSHSVISLISETEEDEWDKHLFQDEWGTDIRDDIKELFRHLSSLFEENNQSNPSLQDITTYFINTSWWNGVWLGIDRHPSIAKSMKLQTTVMADFLFTAGKRLSLASMAEVISNEPDLLEGV
uniref:Uncharacterized protein n=1 Tax=Ditylum brightwellii TaxID=49249 RepID=A0A7S2A0V2_9STRA|mmetsp:Transcript_6123/g.9325  ORF Transcript_6123/g.9325 Transcript_6123/m.9325 type:complete len:266 (+) Transcript_6123:93-890(+)